MLIHALNAASYRAVGICFNVAKAGFTLQIQWLTEKSNYYLLCSACVGLRWSLSSIDKISNIIFYFNIDVFLTPSTVDNGTTHFSTNRITFSTAIRFITICWAWPAASKAIETKPSTALGAIFIIRVTDIAS